MPRSGDYVEYKTFNEYDVFHYPKHCRSCGLISDGYTRGITTAKHSVDLSHMLGLSTEMSPADLISSSVSKTIVFEIAIFLSKSPRPDRDKDLCCIYREEANAVGIENYKFCVQDEWDSEYGPKAVKRGYSFLFRTISNTVFSGTGAKL